MYEIRNHCLPLPPEIWIVQCINKGSSLSHALCKYKNDVDKHIAEILEDGIALESIKVYHILNLASFIKDADFGMSWKDGVIEHLIQKR